jgi:hypothetical protein
MKKHIKSKKHRGGWFKKGITIKGIPFEKKYPGMFDGRTCYRIGAINWCTRKKK